jgi:hypothetical protein
MSKGIEQALRENPAWGSLPPHVLLVLAWSYRYVEDSVPTRSDVGRALVACQHQRVPRVG